MSQPRPNTRAATSKQHTGATSGQGSADSGEAGVSPHGASPQRAAEPSNTEIQKAITDLSATLCTKIDNLSHQIVAMNLRVNKVEETVNDVEKTVNFNAGKVTDLEKELPQIRKCLKDEIAKLNEKLTIMEIYNRKMNLLFYGVEEQQHENISDTLQNVLSHLGIEERRATSMKFANAHRLPSRGDPPENAEAPRRPPRPSPIIVKFLSMADRDYVLSSFEKQQRQRPGATPDQPALAPQRITVRADLPPALKKRRGFLAQEAYKLRKDQNLSTRIKLQGAEIILQWKVKGTTAWKLYQE